MIQYNIIDQTQFYDKTESEQAKIDAKKKSLERNIETLDSLNLLIISEFGIDVRDKSRKRFNVDLRMIFCKLIRDIKNKPKITQEFIASYINLDHSSIVHACKTYDSLYLVNPKFKELADYISNLNKKTNKYYFLIKKFNEDTNEQVREKTYKLIADHILLKNNNNTFLKL